jgi:hypothetical protein
VRTVGILQQFNHADLMQTRVMSARRISLMHLKCFCHQQVPVVRGGEAWLGEVENHSDKTLAIAAIEKAGSVCRS